jgi:4-amino-4-deoxy-L-arabinose transferase-like glycosyltransferase
LSARTLLERPTDLWAPLPLRPKTDESARRFLEPHEVLALLAALAGGVAIRLIHIAQPFVDGWSWRESDVAMIARNFSRHGFNIFFPQIDWAGNAPGYVGTEFPLVPFMASGLYLLFGEHEWIGRCVSVFFFAASVPFLYLLVRKVWNEGSALVAVGTYTLAPFSIFSSRAFMPDMASLTLSIAALYLFAEWLDREAEVRLFAASSAAASLAILVKLPAIVIGLPLVYLAARALGARFVRIGRLWMGAALMLGFPLAWYLHAYTVSRAHFPYHMFGEGGLQVVSGASYVDIAWRTVTSGLTPLVALGMAVGLVLPCRSRFGAVFHWWLAGIILFTFLAGRGSWHPWYQLPVVPVAAALAGRTGDVALTRATRGGGRRLALGLGILYLAAVAALSAVGVRPLYEPTARPLREAGMELDRIAPPDALVVFTEWDPTIVYYSGRKGWRLERDGLPWAAPRDTEEAIRDLEALRARGARYLVFSRYSRWWFDRYPGFQRHVEFRYQRVRHTDDYTIFDLAPADAV